MDAPIRNTDIQHHKIYANHAENVLYLMFIVSMDSFSDNSFRI